MVATFENLGFEVVGAAPGLAVAWTLEFLASAEEIAGYGTPELPQEAFERGWASNESFVFAFAPEMLVPALFDATPESVEDFEDGWSANETFLRQLASVAAADYHPGDPVKLVEDFDSFWNANEGFRRAFEAGDLVAAPIEPFELGWRSNESFVFAFGGGDIALGPMETFEVGWPLLEAAA